jgi:hypothetical protein
MENEGLHEAVEPESHSAFTPTLSPESLSSWFRLYESKEAYEHLLGSCYANSPFIPLDGGVGHPVFPAIPVSTPQGDD